MQISRSDSGASLSEPSVRLREPERVRETRDLAERERVSSRDTVRIRPVWVSKRPSCERE